MTGTIFAVPGRARLLLLCLLFAVTACVSSGSTQTTARTVTVPGPVALDSDTVTPDVKLVAAAVIHKLRGSDDEIVAVRFDPSAMQVRAERDFHFEGFRLVNLGITGYSAKVVSRSQVDARLEGILRFQDVLGRSASVFFAAKYTVGRRDILVHASRSVNIAAAAPRIETYVVPAKALLAARGTLKTYGDYYLFAIENAEPMTSQAGDDSMSPEDDYIIISFCKDRLRPESELEMKVSSRRSLSGTPVIETAYLYENGWRIMMAGGRFRPGSLSNKFYVGVIYNIDPRKKSEPMTLALYQNKKMEYQPTMEVTEVTEVAGTPPAQVLPAAATPSGPLSSGAIFLNLGSPDDVGLIQQRLKALGYYNMIVDRALGPGTRQALDSFADANGLPRGLWTIDMQRRLFAGTGL